MGIKMTELRDKWNEVEKDGLPQNAGTFICIVRGATSLILMEYAPDRSTWASIGQAGVMNKNVTHWHKIPEHPKILWMNVLLKKATSEGLDDDEKLELSQLLKDSI